MTDAPRRKRLQVHLSTAVVMMIAAGVLIWANVTNRAGPVEPALFTAKDYSFGWPIRGVTSFEVVEGQLDNDGGPLVLRSRKVSGKPFLYYSVICADVFVCPDRFRDWVCV